MRTTAWMTGLWLAVSGCTLEPVLVPGVGAAIVRGTETVVFVEAQGVRAWVDGAAWRGEPSSLGQVMTPVSVTLQNHSGRPVRVSYDDFSLLGATGFRYPALAPLPGQMATSAREPEPGQLVLAHSAQRVPPAHRARRIPSHRFFIAPHYSYWYPSFGLWSHPFPYDPGYYARWSWPAALPSEDMLAHAMPEGVVEHEGRVEGFVYFQPVGRRESSVRFQLRLADASTGQVFGQLDAPLAVRRD